MSETSPPTSTVVYGLKIPSQSRNNRTNDDYMFLLRFEVIDDGIENGDVSFTVQLNPAREKNCSPPPSPDNRAPARACAKKILAAIGDGF